MAINLDRLKCEEYHWFWGRRRLNRPITKSLYAQAIQLMEPQNAHTLKTIQTKQAKRLTSPYRWLDGMLAGVYRWLINPIYRLFNIHDFAKNEAVLSAVNLILLVEQKQQAARRLQETQSKHTQQAPAQSLQLEAETAMPTLVITEIPPRAPVTAPLNDSSEITTSQNEAVLSAVTLILPAQQEQQQAVRELEKTQSKPAQSLQLEAETAAPTLAVIEIPSQVPVTVPSNDNSNITTLQQAADFFGFNLADPLTNDMVKNQFRKKVIEYHPDKQPGNEAAFKRLNQANTILQEHLQTDVEAAESQRITKELLEQNAKLLAEGQSSALADHSLLTETEDAIAKAKKLLKKRNLKARQQTTRVTTDAAQSEDNTSQGLTSAQRL